MGQKHYTLCNFDARGIKIYFHKHQGKLLISILLYEVPGLRSKFFLIFGGVGQNKYFELFQGQNIYFQKLPAPTT